MLTCACGARFEIDESLAGQEVLCPECQQPIQAPAAARLPRVTSGWALASVLLALVGAFTIFGTIAAVLLGLIALANISRHRDRVAGVGFAIFGICLGLVFTALTLVVLNASDIFGLEPWLRERTMGQKLDTSGPLEVVQGNKGFAITRPNEKWGLVPDNDSKDPAVEVFQSKLDLLLMQLARNAFIDVRRLPAGAFQSLDRSEAEVLGDLKGEHLPGKLFDDDEDAAFRRPVHVNRLNQRRLEPKDDMEGRETEAEVRCAGRRWLFLIRLYRRGNGRIYVVRAYGPEKRFGEIRNELEKALESFRILRR